MGLEHESILNFLSHCYFIYNLCTWNPKDPCFNCSLDLDLEGSTTTIKDEQVPGIYICFFKSTEVWTNMSIILIMKASIIPYLTSLPFHSRQLATESTLPKTNSEFIPKNGWLEDKDIDIGVISSTEKRRECPLKNDDTWKDKPPPFRSWVLFFFRKVVFSNQRFLPFPPRLTAARGGSMLSQDRFGWQAPKGFQKNDAQGNHDAHCKLNMLDQPFFKWFPKSLTWTISGYFD